MVWNEPDFVGLSGCVSNPNEKDLPEIMFRQFRYKYCGLEKRTPPVLTYADGQAMVAVAEGKSAEIDSTILKRLESYGYIKKSEDVMFLLLWLCARKKLIRCQMR